MAEMGNKAKNSVVMQWLFQGLSGLAVVTKDVGECPSLHRQRLNKKKPTKDQENLLTGFEFIRTQGPRANNANQMAEWTELQINDPEGPLKGWDRTLVARPLVALIGL